MLRIINDKELYVMDHEFPSIPHKDWFNLRIVGDLSRLEQQAALIRQVRGDARELTLYNTTHGGWLALELQKDFASIIISCSDAQQKELVQKNLRCTHVKICVELQRHDRIWSLDTGTYLTTKPEGLLWTQQNTWLNGPGIKLLHPSHLLDDHRFSFDNLVHLLMMVKNAGALFRQVLLDNLSLCDRWTILDTGSTDGTQDVIREVMASKPGTLYEESFVDFKYSRNRLLDLAGTRCKYNLMLDDTYVVQGNLRAFLEEIRGDQYGSSYSLYVHSYDSEYSSNRITKPEKHLRYIYRIHEVITPENNINVMIPNSVAYIEDRNNEYMKQRTEARKQWDLQMLFQEVQDYPDDPRALYYIAQTYRCLEDWPKTYEYYLLRANHPKEGFIQEKIDALFEAARCANFQLNMPWSICKDLYRRSYTLDKSRPDALYFLGVHYLNHKKHKALRYFTKAFRKGYPLHCQYSLKPTLSFYFLPKFLVPLCYEFQKYDLGLQVAEFFCKHNPEVPELKVFQSWRDIFAKLLLKPLQSSPSFPDKKLIVFCADGNWVPWTGRDIEDNGLGGSETWVVESAREYQKRGYQVYVFCRCYRPECYEGVEYRDLSNYPNFIYNNFIDTVFVSRYSEWLPLTYEAPVSNVYLWVHDVAPSGIVIPDSPKLKNICCLSQWHQDSLRKAFPALAQKITYKYYGPCTKVELGKKIPDRFIYSSTANRGLVHVLRLWPEILKILPTATLEIFCDVNLHWANEVAKDDLQEIKTRMREQGILYRGWCNKRELSAGFARSTYWLYPCTFPETFCLTAVEAAIHRVLPITNGLAALGETARRGITIFGEINERWYHQVLQVLMHLQTQEGQEIHTKMLNDGETWANTLSWV